MDQGEIPLSGPSRAMTGLSSRTPGKSLRQSADGLVDAVSEVFELVSADFPG
jgi:hypothetical protein